MSEIWPPAAPPLHEAVPGGFDEDECLPGQARSDFDGSPARRVALAPPAPAVPLAPSGRALPKRDASRVRPVPLLVPRHISHPRLQACAAVAGGPCGMRPRSPIAVRATITHSAANASATGAIK